MPSSKGQKRTSRAHAEPNSENDFLEAADEMEKSMSKWRVGDPEKALRFFDRALESYNKGLQRYPRDFDLAYNKANLQYNAATTFSEQLGDKQTVALLRDAVGSHKYALSLEVDADTLFNAAQSLSSLAEEIYETESSTPPRLTMEPLSLGVEAIQLLEKCLDLQETEHRELQDAVSDATIRPDTETSAEEATQQWATVHKSVTVTDLLDTSLALLDVISDVIRYTPLSIYDQTTVIGKIKEFSVMGDFVMEKKLQGYLQLIKEDQTVPLPQSQSAGLKVLSLTSGTIRTEELNTMEDPVSKAISQVEEKVVVFQSNLTTAQFRVDVLSIQQYALRLQDIFENPQLSSLETVFPLYAQHLEEFSDVITEKQDVEESLMTSYRWEALEKVDSILAKSIERASSPNSRSKISLTDLYDERADMVLHRRWVGMLPSASPSMTAAGLDLLSTASGFYTAALAYAKQESKTNQEVDLGIKLIVVRNMASAVTVNLPATMTGFRRDDVKRVVEGMYEDQLIPTVPRSV